MVSIWCNLETHLRPPIKGEPIRSPTHTTTDPVFPLSWVGTRDPVPHLKFRRYGSDLDPEPPAPHFAARQYQLLSVSRPQYLRGTPLHRGYFVVPLVPLFKKHDGVSRQYRIIVCKLSRLRWYYKWYQTGVSKEKLNLCDRF